MGKERLSGNFFATTVPAKGGKGRFDVNRILEFIAECGDGSNDIILKSDQEPSMQFLLKEVMLERGSASDLAPARGSSGILVDGDSESSAACARDSSLDASTFHTFIDLYNFANSIEFLSVDRSGQVYWF